MSRAIFPSMTSLGFSGKSENNVREQFTNTVVQCVSLLALEHEVLRNGVLEYIDDATTGRGSLVNGTQVGSIPSIGPT